MKIIHFARDVTNYFGKSLRFYVNQLFFDGFRNFCLGKSLFSVGISLFVVKITHFVNDFNIFMKITKFGLDFTNV